MSLSSRLLVVVLFSALAACRAGGNNPPPPKTPPVNRAPVGSDGSASGNEDAVITGTLAATDADGDALQYAVASAPAHGTVVLGEGSSYTYTPSANFNGTDSFTFTASDGKARSAAATVTLTIAPVNDAPVANAGALAGDEDSSFPADPALSGSDVDGDALTFEVDQGPSHGTLLTASDGTITYTPYANYSGTDSFTFTASDGRLTSEAATVTITLTDTAEPTFTVARLSDGEETADGSKPVKLSLTFSRAPDAAVTLTCVPSGGSARASDLGSCADVTIPRGATPEQLTQTVTLPVVDDSFQENTETVDVALAPKGANDAAGTDTATASTSASIKDNDDNGLLRVGSAKRALTPTDAQIAGIEESRAFGAGTHKQFFNLGGFGINVGQNLPDPLGDIPAQATTTEPATRAVFRNAAGTLEHTYLRLMLIETPDAPAPEAAIPVPGVVSEGGSTVVLVMMDAIGAGNLIQQGVKNAIIAHAAAKGLTLQPENILFGQTHSHTAADLQGLWGGVPQDWINSVLYVAAGNAFDDAYAGRKPARLSFRQGRTSDFNNYRRPRIQPGADADDLMTLLTARSDEGEPIGNVLQYSAHPTSVGDGNIPRTPHGEYVYGAMAWLDRQGGNSLYFNGPIADASPSGSRPGCVNTELNSGDPSGADFGNVRCRGEGIADYLLHPSNVIVERELASKVESRSVQVVLPITNPAFLAAAAAGSFNRYYNFSQLPVDQIPGLEEQGADLPQIAPVAMTTVSRITLGGEGGLELVTIPGETTNTFGQYIRGLSKNPVMLMGLTHNSFGYILPEDEFSYINPDGDDGFVFPYTGYEEFVSMGPLNAPLLRNVGYNRLFGVDPTTGDTHDVPPSVSACLENVDHPACVLQMVENRIDAIVGQYFAGALQQIADGCRAAGAPEMLCGIFGTVATGSPAINDALLATQVAKMTAQGCDILDPAYCLFPFPNDAFTVAAADGSIQAKTDDGKGGTGRRVNLNPLAMPRNSAGKPVDPTEWNRNDGFSPGQMIVTYVPGLAANDNGTIPGAAPITDIERSLDADAPIFVIDADTGERHLVWAEVDLNNNLLLHGALPQVEDPAGIGEVDRPLHDGRQALIVRPASNFREGHRYIVALRNLKDRFGRTLRPNLGFRACLGQTPSLLAQQSPLKERCDHLNEVVDTLARFEPGLDSRDLYLAWDFTVASAQNNVGRLAHMRDVAFNSLATVPGTDCTQLTAANVAACAAPTFTVDKVIENPRGGILRRVEGTLTIPSFVTPVDPAPLDNQPAGAARNAALPVAATPFQLLCAQLPAAPDEFPEEFRDGWDELREGCSGAPETAADGAQITGGAALPPNRLFYSPLDGDPAVAAADPSVARYGDGLPDTVGTMQTPFICMIPSQATTQPARASIYGHGLLDARVAVTYEGSPEMESEHNFMYCAVDLFGFATGDLGNVASSLVDLSQFPVIPDGSQQGLLNYMFLARAMRDPKGFITDAAFRDGAKPLFDTREIFYNGNSQGGIVGGAVLAISKDINRGVLGSLGMNYSTLLQRSKDFDPYSTVLYSSYPDPLDRMFLFSFMQMLWDRSENNGYAEHLTEKSPVEGGPVDHVMLNSMFADQQVTMWSADVMARTMGIEADYGMVTRAGKRHPDEVPGWPMAAPDYYVEAGKRYSDVSSVLYDYSGFEFSDNIPVGNIPMREGPDPHDISHRRRQGRCQISHWLQREGRLLDINTADFTPEAGDRAISCPAIRDNSGAPAPGEFGGPGGVDLPGALGGAGTGFAGALALAGEHLAAGEFKTALDTLIGGVQQLIASATQAIAVAVGDAAGIFQPAPGPAGVINPDPERLLAGAAKGEVRVPVGTPLGGYLRPPVGGEYIGDDPVGELTDTAPAANDGCDPTAPDTCLPLVQIPDELRKVHSPYATYSPPSRGYYDSLLAKAVALYDGHDYVVLVKTDFIGMLDELVQDVKAKVKADTSIDLGDGLIMSATHSHDGPGAVANNSTRYFWLAMDVYQHDVYLRVVHDLAEVVKAALANLQPAKIGHANGLESPETVNGNGINGYRRGRLPSYADNDAPGCAYVTAAQCPAGIDDANELRKRIGVIRVDSRATGDPIALVINFADHGIAFDVENQYFSGDVLASIERETEQLMKLPIAMLVQNTGGDVTPKNVEYSIRGIEQLGKRMAPQVRAIAQSIVALDERPDLRTVSQRVILNRDTLDYAADEYPYPWGAAQCGNDVAVPFADVGANDIPGYDQTGGPTKMPYCIPGVPPDAADLADNGVAENGAFVPGDTILYAAKIGAMTLMVNPGEPLTEYGVRLMEMAQEPGLGFNPKDTFIWGYSGDHIGYILPPVREDFEQFGGAESTTTFWGWKQGQRFIDVQRELLRALKTGTAAPADEFAVDYSKYRAVYDAKPAVPATPSLLPGAIVTQPKSIKRFEKTVFVFEGGDPVVDYPKLTMIDAATGLPVRRANGEPVTTYFENHLKYRLTTGRHLWTVEFEAPKDWAAGSYRFHLEGVANQGMNAPYEVDSAAFTVSAATNLSLSGVKCENGSCVADLKYAAVPSNYRAVDAFVNNSTSAPVRQGIVTFVSGAVTRRVAVDNEGRASAQLPGGSVTVSGEDAFGNLASSVTVGPPAPDADDDGVPDSADTCPNTPAGTEVDANGCPVDEPAGLRLCEPVSGDEYCLEDIPGIGPALQDAVDMVYNALTGGGGGVPALPADVALAAADSLARGCDPLDPSACLYPFPSDQYTVAIQEDAASQNIHTGRRVNFNPLAMPRNIAGKPIDPTEWNRNDGFSPGSMIVTYVPGLDRAGLLRTFGFTPDANPDADARVGVTNPELTTREGSPIQVIDAATGERHPVWAEMDVNADYILPQADELGGQGIDRPQPGRSSLILRPARNFTPGHRYVVVLRDLKTAAGDPIAAGAVFAACRDGAEGVDGTALQARCDQLLDRVFPTVEDAGIDVAGNRGLFLAWDFTVASAENITSRLTHMRDDAFKALAKPAGPLPFALPILGGGATDCTRYDYSAEPADLSAVADGYIGGCRSPDFTVDSVKEVDGGEVIEIQGTLKVPSYLQQQDPSPLEAAEFQSALDAMRQSVPGADQVLNEDLFFTAQPFNLLPPNRLNYDPADNTAPPLDPNAVSLVPYGDGLPDRVAGVGEMTTRYLCEVKKSVYEGTEAAARPALYGHGLLQSRAGLTYDEGRRMVKRNNFMLCGLDWFGFSQGDLHNVAVSLVDMSNFPTIPDASQQGMLNFMFLARALQHPGGFASHEAFRRHAGGAPAAQPFFDRSEVFYYGNSQGGILPGPVVAVSKDVNRAVFGVPGMNYSTLLRRSSDFTLYSIPLYLSYQDELDRNLVFGLVQMIWDRAENDGFAAYLTRDGEAVHGGLPGGANLDGQDNLVLLHPAFSDHQVSYYTADVMARTMNARSDRQQITDDEICRQDASKCAREVIPNFGLPAVQYVDKIAPAGPTEVIWRRPEVKAPPVVELPPHDAENGPDPHGYPRNHAAAVCQMTHFLRHDGVVVDVFPLWRVNGVDQKDNNGFVQAECDSRYGRPRLPPTVAKPGFTGEGSGGTPDTPAANYGPGLLGAFSQFMGELNTAITAALSGDSAGAQTAVADAAGNLAGNVAALPTPGEADPVVGVVGDSPVEYAGRESIANRSIEAVVLTGDRLGTWSVPAAFGLPYPYPSGATQSGVLFDNDPTGTIPGQVRDAHNGVMLYPQAGAPAGKPVERIAAYRYDGAQFVEIPVQVDERFPYFLANANSDFSVYSGTDEELSYAWDSEQWDAGGTGPNAEYPDPTADPVAGLDHDDEIVFMYRDAGDMAPPQALPVEPDFDPAGGLQEVALADPLQPGVPKFVYLGLKREGTAPKFAGQAVYVHYRPDANADQWLDRGAFCENDPEKLGTSNTGYGPNRSGNVYVDAGACAPPFPQVTRATPRSSNDRFPRDGVTVTTDTYRWRATGRWMVREINIDNPATPQLDYGADLIDRWKGRAFQQSPDSVISLVGFEDEQVNWEANSTLLGKRCGPVRCIREVWGADSGTNVTKTETFYRDAVASRYRVRVHPIPPDGLYTSWDYNRGAMVPTPAEKAAGVPEGRYFSALRPQGVPVDGINDDVGQSDRFPFCRQLYDSAAAGALFPPLAQIGGVLSPATEAIPFAGTTLNPYDLQSCAAFFDAADPTFNLPLAFNNWEQVSGKGSLGSLVYVFEVKGPTSFGNPLVVPYYRDDACLDDGTGDDPVSRPFPGESYSWNNGAVPKAYNARAGRGPNEPLVDCSQRQGAYGSHGVHYFLTHDSDNAFVMGKPSTEADAQWWQIMVPTAQPENRGAEHANVVRAPVQAVVTPRPGLVGPAPAPAGAFRVGAAKVDSTPDQALCTGGYGIFCGWRAEGARPNALGGTDRLYTRAIVIGSGDDRIALVTTSAIGLFASYKDEISTDGSTRRRPGLYDTRLRVADETGIAFDHIFIQSDHSHRSPDTVGIWGGVPAAYYQQIQDDMAEAVRLAASRLEPAALTVGAIDGKAISCPATFPYAPGKAAVPMRCTVDSLYSYDPNKVVDDQFRLLEARRPDGSLIASFANYSPHATVLDDTGSAVFSGDWTGWLAAMLDEDASGAVGLATVGTLGRTDFESGNNTGDGDGRNLNREKAARARLSYFLGRLRSGAGGAGVTPLTPVTGTGIRTAEIFLREVVTNPIFYGNYAPFVGAPAGSYPSETQASIDRSITPPFLTGNALGTFAGAFRIGDLFFATAPGEEFPNAQVRLRDESGVSRPQMHFFMGATNDFLGYMGPATSYDQVVAQGSTYFFCPPGDFERQARDTLSPATGVAGYEAGRLFDEGSCPDHFILMASPTIGDHVTCAIQNAAESIGFTAAVRDPACAALTATDNLLPPPTALAGSAGTTAERGLLQLAALWLEDAGRAVADTLGGDLAGLVGTVQLLAEHVVQGVTDLLIGNPTASVQGVVTSLSDGNPSDTPATVLSLILGNAPGTARAGAAVIDMTPDVGYCAGQYCDGLDDTAATFDLVPELGGNDGVDPFLTAKTKQKSYGVQSRLTARAIVVEGANGKRIALLKTDNYLAQDSLIRRVAQILEQGRSGISYDQILYHVTHNHSSSYSSTPSWGVWVFEDAFDYRFFEQQARRMAAAIELAAARLKPARMGATTVSHTAFKGNVVRHAIADDGTPAGYPVEFGDHGVVVVRFDEIDGHGDFVKPIATWMNWGEHPEGLDGEDLHSADFLAALERFVDRETGAPLVFSQGDVGSAEASGNECEVLDTAGRPLPGLGLVTGFEDNGKPLCGNAAKNAAARKLGTWRDWEHEGYVQIERNVRFLADAVVEGWHEIGAGRGQVPYSADFPVDFRNAFVPGPVSQPAPMVSNCRTEPSAGGNIGVPVLGLPDCAREGQPGSNPITDQARLVYETLKAEGVPVPDHYGFTGFTGVEENLRLKLQAFRLGEVLLASCACEAQVDLILNLETRADDVAGNIYDGFDWACVVEDRNPATRDPAYAKACEVQRTYFNPADYTAVAPVPGSLADAAKVAHMRAQIHNDARDWDLPVNAAAANSEPADVRRIWGNFTKEELPVSRGYKLVVGVGHAGDYNGYTVSYREYMNRDSYRKALTAYGPHTADYMVTRLVRMAGAMKGGAELAPESHDGLADVDEARMVAQSTALGQAASAAYDAWQAALPPDVGPEQILAGPAASVPQFSAATVRWVGGNTQVDNPSVKVQIERNGAWQNFADMSGEVQTRVYWPADLATAASVYAGQYRWEWLANFETFLPPNNRLDGTPADHRYRFVIDGCINDNLSGPNAEAVQGRLTSLLMAAAPDAAQGLLAQLLGDGCPGGSRPYHLESTAFDVVPRTGPIPKSYASAFPYIGTGDDGRFCKRCTFRPWEEQ